MSNINSIMYSGGVDSFLVYQWLRKTDTIFENLNLLYFNLGARCNNSEIELFNSCNFKKHVSIPVMISDALNMGGMETESAYIPNRNILAAIMNNSVTNSDNIWIGGTLSDRVNDNNREIFDDLSKLMTKMHKRDIVITSPFFDSHKCSLVFDYVFNNGWNHYENQQDARKSLVEATFSCYDPLFESQQIKAHIENEVVEYCSRECLECPACFRKCMSLYAGDIFIAMKDNEKSNGFINHYKEEAEREVTKHDEMYERYVATLDYCAALENFRLRK